MTASNKFNLTVELRPHIGTRDDPIFGPVEVEHNQWVVMAGSRQIEMGYGVPAVQVAYAGKNTRTVDFLSHVLKWPKESLDFIVEEVERLTGTPRRGLFPPSIKQATVEDLDEVDSVIDLDE